jgi:hypothetical protein
MLSVSEIKENQEIIMYVSPNAGENEKIPVKVTQKFEKYGVKYIILENSSNKYKYNGKTGEIEIWEQNTYNFFGYLGGFYKA